MSRCLCCYKELRDGEKDFHPHCARKFFGTKKTPLLPYTRDDISRLAKETIRSSVSVPGVQSKLSLEMDRGKRNEPSKLTIVGLWGKYILKPQSNVYPSLPELEDLTMKMAEASGIETARHSLIRFQDGELAYITQRMDRESKNEKISMLDMCQLSNRLTEHKYLGSYEQIAGTIRNYSAAPYLDLQRFWEVVLFSWFTGNSDMHCKNFSLYNKYGNDYILTPAYDLVAALLVMPSDQDELALSLNRKHHGITRDDFLASITASGIDEKIANTMVQKMLSSIEKWSDLIDNSFIPDEMKETYKKLIETRCRHF